MARPLRSARPLRNRLPPRKAHAHRIAYHPQDELAVVAVRLTSYLRRHAHILTGAINKDLASATLSTGDLVDALGKDGAFLRLLDDLPEATLAALGVAVCEVHYETREPSQRAPIVRLSIHLIGHGPVSSFRDLKAFQIGKFVSIQGNLVRISAVRPQPRSVAFQCAKCLQTFVIHMPGGVYTTPRICATNRCSSKAFTPDRKHPQTVYVNWQRIKIQEIHQGPTGDGADAADEGRIPRIFEAELSNDLVDSLVPGESATLSGILKALDGASGSSLSEVNNRTSSGGPQGSTSAQTTSTLYLDVNSIVKNRMNDATLEGVAEGSAASRSSPREGDVGGTCKGTLQEILDVANAKDTIATLVRSFCPRIFGNEMVKLGLLLTLFGGSRRSGSFEGSASQGGSGGKGRLAIRSDPHVLVVGDPGLGKSQLLNFASAVAPRAVYVCANTSTAAGLTATVQDGALEAGALVLADQGVCCIDEFDKIAGDGWRSLLDVMEQQSVNVAKAGVICTLPARTSVVAAANPVGGHYNRAKSIVDNLKMDAALLSRFDLVFILLDRPNADLDRVLSEHVLGNTTAGAGTQDASGGTTTGNGFSTIPPTQAPPTAPSSEAVVAATTKRPHEALGGSAAGLSPAYVPLSRLLNSKGDAALPTMSPSLLRKYIAYARQNVTPRMTREAAQILCDFYLSLRRRYSYASDGPAMPPLVVQPAGTLHPALAGAQLSPLPSEEMLPITTRHLESMIRLGEARAKAELRSHVSVQDAHDVISLVEYCTLAIMESSPEGGSSQARTTTRPKVRGGGGRSATIKAFVSELIKISARTLTSAFTLAQLQSLYEALHHSADAPTVPFRDLIDCLNENGYLLKKGTTYQLLVT